LMEAAIESCGDEFSLSEYILTEGIDYEIV